MKNLRYFPFLILFFLSFKGSSFAATDISKLKKINILDSDKKIFLVKIDKNASIQDDLLTEASEFLTNNYKSTYSYWNVNGFPTQNKERIKESKLDVHSHLYFVFEEKESKNHFSGMLKLTEEEIENGEEKEIKRNSTALLLSNDFFVSSLVETKVNSLICKQALNSLQDERIKSGIKKFDTLYTSVYAPAENLVHYYQNLGFKIVGDENYFSYVYPNGITYRSLLKKEFQDQKYYSLYYRMKVNIEDFLKN